ncbi:hypothetical protein ACQKLP_17750 [Chitinophaga sp. NPDC101104]|uniref:hypothetical protein n=1 Tax=Chitinophaga sp. NPDC101104 TaxID=3390561 RepID=UPI003CFCF8D4
MLNRLTAPTPPFFQKVRNLGLLLTAVASAVIGLPLELELPLTVLEIAGGLAVAGSMMAGLGQAAVKSE